MPLADLDKVNIEVSINGTIAALGGDDQLTVTPMHYIRTASPGSYSASAFVTAFQAAVQSAWLACASVSWNWDKTRVRVLNSPTEAELEVLINAPGSVIGDMVPSYVAAILSKKSALRGRSYQGRMYFPALPKSGTLGNALTAGHATLLGALKTALLANIADANGNVWTPAILSRLKSKLGKTPDPSVVTMTPMNVMIVKTVLGRQSQRKSKVK